MKPQIATGIRLIIATFAATLSALVITTAPALGRTVHVLSSSFTGSGANALSAPAGVAVNDESEDVYVVDTGHNRVEQFNSTGGTVLGEFNGSSAPTGAFSAPEAIAVDNDLLSGSHGDVYVADTGHSVIDEFSSTGTYEGQLTGTCETAGETPPACVGSTFIAFEELRGVAVDAEGNVWVYEDEAASEGEVAEFSDSGLFLKAFRTERGTKPGIALDSSGHVYVVFGSGDVGEYEASSGTELGKNEHENAAGIAVDANDLFIDTARSIEEYGLTEPFSSRVEVFPISGLTESGGVAASAAGTIYATQRATGSVEIFAEDALPEVAVETVSNLAVHSATLNGTVNPAGVEVTSCAFEYGTTESYGSLAACSPAPGSGSAAVSVSANLTGLLPDTTYDYRLVATNADHLTEATSGQMLTTRGPGIAEEQVTHVQETAATLQVTIDPNESETTYHFEYDTTPYTTSASHGTSLPSAKIPPGTSAVPVSAQLEGLAPDSTYYYRVVAESEPLGAPETFDGPGKTLTTNAAPSSGLESCPNDQRRSEQPYGTSLPDCRAYELVSPLNKAGHGIGFGGARAARSTESPAVTYESQGSFPGSGPEPLGAPYLSRYLSRRGPEGWSTENITPPNNTFTPQLLVPFAELLFTPNLSAGVLFNKDTPLVAGEPAGYNNLYRADLGDGSYQTVTNVTPSGEAPYEGLPPLPWAEGASTDLSHIVFQERWDLTPNATENERRHVYEWVGGRLSLVDVPPEGVTFAGADTVGAPTDIERSNLGDEWHAISENGLRVFFTGGENTAPHELGQLGQLYVRENPEQPPANESRCGVPGDACTIEVSKSQRTNAEGKPTPDPHGPQPAFFRGASADGSRVFFTSRAELTNDANTGKEDNAANLYEYNLETGILTDLTVPAATLESEDPDGAAVLGLVTAGEDGSYVYFVANGVLSKTPNGEGDAAAPGTCKVEAEEALHVEAECNLYVEHYDGSAWEAPRFIARLAGGTSESNNANETGDGNDWVGYEYAGDSGYTPESSPAFFDNGPVQHTARVTGDGSTLAFLSERSLTGYDTEQARVGECEVGEGEGGHGGYVTKTGKCHEVYVYDALTGKLVCASCDPSGARPVGAAEFGGREEDYETKNYEEPSAFYIPHNLSDNGERLFFQSPDALVPYDSNARLDVYEWERPASSSEAAQAENSCTSASPDFHAGAEGCLLPVSGLAGDYDSHFMDASANGNDVFIATADQLVPSDTDTRVDVYDARIGGGFPVSSAPPTCDNGDSCKLSVSPQPAVFGAPASATFSGLGNPAPPVTPPAAVKKKAVKCKKPKKRDHRKCVFKNTRRARARMPAKRRK